ncbi:hypothetical protein EDC04DRAFT_2565093 [Pisolithus marmoratus]|nr:hypothetical protein EDC04DRAFT_2565093 [Pisolithus marmoratus]
MASEPPLQPTTATNARKRKTTDDLAALNPAKQSKIQSFFAPRVPLSVTCGTDQTMSVAELSHEQNKVLQMVVEDRKNVFFTGSAGTGKSLLLRAIITRLRKKHSGRSDYVAVTASTGMAASNIGG